jgi:hypothetical protein
MSRKIDINLDNPIIQAGSIAKGAVENLKNEFSDASKQHIDNEMIDSLIEVAMQSSFDSSPLVIKQNIRNILKQNIKKST